MKKIFINFIITIQTFVLLISSILFFIFYNSFNIKFYYDFYKKNNLAEKINTTSNELNLNTENLLGYLKGQTELNSTWFSVDDINHMVDVKNLYEITYKIMWIMFFIFIILFFITYLFLKKETLKYIATIFNKVIVLFILLLVTLTIIISINFNSFWITFHKTLFSNDLWLLDPASSNLIKMVPEQFFIDLIVKIITHCSLWLLLLICTNFIIKKFKK